MMQESLGQLPMLDLAGRAPTHGSAIGSASSSAAAAPAAPPAAPAMAMRPRRPRKVADGSGESAARGKQQHSRSGAGESRGGGGETSDGEGGAPEAGEPAEKKARFVWTPEMHLRFERAVHKLGVPHAKPQAIRQLMGCEGEEYAPTRQNIKSHLQKYRQSRQNSSHAADGPSALDGAPAPHAQQQQLNLLQQLEMQSKLHEELLRQRQDQAELAVHLSGSGREAMRPEQLTRLAQHVMLQRQLLHHLFALLQAHTEDVMREGSQARRRPPPSPFPHLSGHRRHRRHLRQPRLRRAAHTPNQTRTNSTAETQTHSTDRAPAAAYDNIRTHSRTHTRGRPTSP